MQQQSQRLNGMNGMVRSRCTQYVYESSVAVTSCQNAVLMPWSKACTTNQSVFEAFGLNPAHSLPLGRKLYGQGRWRWRWWWRPWWWVAVAVAVAGKGGRRPQ